MACNSCSKAFTLFRKEKGCPNCGFSYCSNCLNQKLFLNKLNREAKVCSRCKHFSNFNKKDYREPSEINKQFGVNISVVSKPEYGSTNIVTQDIEHRLRSLKEEKPNVTTNDEIVQRLQNIKGTQPSTSDAELRQRLANLKGVPLIDNQNKPILLVSTSQKSEQEQADELLKNYIEQVSIDKQYKDGFEKQIDDIESRIQKLKGRAEPNQVKEAQVDSDDDDGSEDEIKQIIEKVKTESLLDVDEPVSINDELPFCEICNEDAKMRCLGCRYLFCKRCFLDHRDDDDGCNTYETYVPPKQSQF